MFREMRRISQQISTEECKEILAKEKRAVLSVIGDDGYPYGVPIDYYFDEEENEIFFHCAKEGHKLDAIRRSDKVCLTVYEQGIKNPDEWWFNPRSVIIFGRAYEVKDSEIATEKIRMIGRKYFPDYDTVEKTIEKHMKNALVLGIEIDHMTGKQVREK